jgi:hypothetical protein
VGIAIVPKTGDQSERRDVTRPLAVPAVQCANFDTEATLGRSLSYTMDRYSQLGTSAALSAWSDAGLPRTRDAPRNDWGVSWGTALGVVRSLHAAGRVALVVADETRPLLQGARITTVELEALDIPHRVVVDGAGPSVIARGLVDAVVVGADRVAANGDVANKIGTYPLALAAARAGIPFVVACPESTVDPATPDGAAIAIEDRAEDEVLQGGPAWNPAFDVTPADLVTAIVTEARVWR